MGKAVGAAVAQRIVMLLELGGNNAVIVEPSADLDLALRAITFSAVGTAGQCCTTMRRMIVHESIADAFVVRLAAAYRTIKIGDPLAEGTLVGPLVNARAVEGYHHAVAEAIKQGGTLVCGGKAAKPAGLAGHFVEPTIILRPASNRLPISDDETFAPILYVFTYKDLDDAIAMNNRVEQGLSSAILTNDVRSMECFIGPAGPLRPGLCQPRHQRRGDRRRVWRREGNRRRVRVRIGFVEGVHAPPDGYDQRG